MSSHTHSGGVVVRVQDGVDKLCHAYISGGAGLEIWLRLVVVEFNLRFETADMYRHARCMHISRDICLSRLVRTMARFYAGSTSLHQLANGYMQAWVLTFPWRWHGGQPRGRMTSYTLTRSSTRDIHSNTHTHTHTHICE